MSIKSLSLNIDHFDPKSSTNKIIIGQKLLVNSKKMIFILNQIMHDHSHDWHVMTSEGVFHEQTYKIMYDPE